MTNQSLVRNSTAIKYFVARNIKILFAILELIAIPLFFAINIATLCYFAIFIAILHIQTTLSAILKKITIPKYCNTSQYYYNKILLNLTLPVSVNTHNGCGTVIY